MRIWRGWRPPGGIPWRSPTGAIPSFPCPRPPAAARLWPPWPRSWRGIDLGSLGYHSAEHVHLLAEAWKRAYADRNTYLADPDFVEMPLDRMISEDYGAERRAPSSWTGPRRPWRWARAWVRPTMERPPTSLWWTRQGNAVSITTTINSFFGSKVTVTGAGFLLNNEMDDFSGRPGFPNQYGLVQGEANAIAPGKRMLSAMTPTIVVDPDGDLLLVVGSPGGATIITNVFQQISNVIDFGMDVRQSPERTPSPPPAPSRTGSSSSPDLCLLRWWRRWRPWGTRWTSGFALGTFIPTLATFRPSCGFRTGPWPAPQTTDGVGRPSDTDSTGRGNMKNTGTSRRDFLRASAVAGGALGLGLVPGACDGPPAERLRSGGPDEKLKILVLGGTGFIGPHTVQYAMDRGHEITLFNRGQSNTDLFPELEKLVGDRNGDLESLRGRHWDVCFDNNASNIDWVEYSTEFLKDSVDRYHYVSSRSAYSDLSSVPMHPTLPPSPTKLRVWSRGRNVFPTAFRRLSARDRFRRSSPRTPPSSAPG